MGTAAVAQNTSIETFEHDFIIDAKEQAPNLPLSIAPKLMVSSSKDDETFLAWPMVSYEEGPVIIKEHEISYQFIALEKELSSELTFSNSSIAPHPNLMS